MTLTEAVSRLQRMRERRIARADGYHVAADAYEERLNDLNEVMGALTRDMLENMWQGALRGERAMLEDAEALAVVLAALAGVEAA